jgi:hypothetical protein
MQAQKRSPRPPKTVVKELARLYSRNGYTRRQNKRRFKKEGSSQYKKGEEVRLLARTRKELQQIRRLLVQAGFKPGRPFAKGTQICQPVYGKQAVARFLELVGKPAAG